MALALAPAPLRAGIYCRISADPTGQRAGVTRQHDDCVALAARLGWEVVALFEDNDTSAFARRPAYQRLVDAVRRGEVDAVVAWHPDRLYRRVRDLLDLIDLAESTRLEVATVQAGDVDLSNANGRLVAKIGASVAEHESEHKAERQRAANAHRRAKGKRSNGFRYRRFAFRDDDVHLHPAEAALVRDAVRRILAGGSLNGTCVEWAAAGVTTTTGGRWRGSHLRRYLENPHLAGWVGYAGEVVRVDGEPLRGPQEILIDPVEWEGLLARFKAGDRYPGRSARSRLLSGFLVCGREECGASLSSFVTGRGKLAYACRPGDSGGCGRLSTAAKPVDDLVSAAVRKTITDAGGLGAALARLESDGGDDAADLEGALRAAEGKVERVKDAYEAGAYTLADFKVRLAAANAELTALADRLAEVTGDAALALADVPTGGERLDGWWADPATPLERKRAVIGALVGRVIIRPARTRGSPIFDPDRVEVVPRRRR